MNEAMKAMRHAILSARERLTKALEYTSKPEVDFDGLWGELSVACHYTSNAEGLAYARKLHNDRKMENDG